MENGNEQTMNRGTYEALRQVGASEEQAIVLASAIPDVKPHIDQLRVDIERRINTQTWTIVEIGRAHV